MRANLTTDQIGIVDRRHDRIAANLVMVTAVSKGEADLVDVVSATESMHINGLDFSRTRVLYVVADLLSAGDATLEIKDGDADPNTGVSDQITALNNAWARVRRFSDLRELAALTPTFEGRMRSNALSSLLRGMSTEEMIASIMADLEQTPVMIEEIRCRYVIGRYPHPVGETRKLVSTMITGTPVVWWGNDRNLFPRLVDPIDAAEMAEETIDCLAGWDDNRNNRGLFAAGWLEATGDVESSMPLWDPATTEAPPILPGAFSLPPYMLARRKSAQAAASLCADLIASNELDHVDIAAIPRRINQLDAIIAGGHLRLVCLDFLGRWASRSLWEIGGLDDGGFTPIRPPEEAVAVIGREWHDFEAGRFGIRLGDRGREIGEHRRELRRTEWETRDLALHLHLWAGEKHVDVADFAWLVEYCGAEDVVDWMGNVMAYAIKHGWLRYTGGGDRPDTSRPPGEDWRRVETLMQTIPMEHLSLAGRLVANETAHPPPPESRLLPDIFSQ